jgi:hypothetical protein
VPGEWELSAEWAGGAVETGGSAFLGDVRGMIVWAPDFRGIWSPTNQDVRRSGMELWGRIRPAATPLTLSGEWSLNRVEYRWDPGLPRVQVVYRPRHSGALRAGWAARRWRAELAARYTGWRNPTPDEANRLPGFWTLDARMGRELRLAGFLLDASLSMDRLGNERDALIFGHPEPGRRVRLDLHFREADKP